MCLQALRGTGQTPPCENTHMDFGKKNQKDARWFLMSTCSGVVIFKMGVLFVCLCCCPIYSQFRLSPSQHLRPNRLIKTAVFSCVYRSQHLRFAFVLKPALQNI